MGRPKFFREGDNHILEFEDGTRIYISKPSLSDAELETLLALHSLMKPLREKLIANEGDLRDIKAIIEKIRTKIGV